MGASGDALSGVACAIHNYYYYYLAGYLVASAQASRGNTGYSCMVDPLLPLRGTV